MLFRTLLPIVLALSACSTVASQAAPPRRAAQAPAATGLFPADAERLTDEAIARILDARWEIPEQVRIALLPLRHDSTFSSIYFHDWSSSSTTSLGLATAFQAVDELRALPYVYDVSYLPEFLLPSERDVALVREAAARYQADWVLCYSTTISATPDYAFLGSDEVHGKCLVECALLDTRTGLIPFTARSSETIDVKEKAKGEEMSALILRAEGLAVDAAMRANARALVAFLRSVERT